MWRAILAGRKALDVGLIKRIEDGKSTNVWKDRWIPDAVGRKPICQRTGATAKLVSDLIEADGISWNQQALAQSLLLIDAQAVWRIPLGRACEDMWAWEGEKHGLYSVRSAYRALVEKEAQDRDFISGRSSHSAGNNNPAWRKIWGAKVPPKVRVFWWRVSHDFIPSKANLHHRHIDKLAACEFCGAERETTFHALLECTYSRSFWSKLKELTGIKLPKFCPRTWTEDLMNDSFCSVTDRGIIMCGLWSLWNSRNDRRHGKDAINPKLAIDWAVDVCFELLSDGLQFSEQAPGQKFERWKTPPRGFLKVNTDGAYCASDATGATGDVIRSDDGSFFQASARRLDPVASALIAEAEAFRDRVRLIPPGTREGIILETDCKELVSLWCSRGNGRSEITSILKEVQELSQPSLRSQFLMCVGLPIQLLMRVLIAPPLSALSSVWAFQPPSFLQASLLLDCNASV
jgi:hypothetical protein